MRTDASQTVIDLIDKLLDKDGKIEIVKPHCWPKLTDADIAYLKENNVWTQLKDSSVWNCLKKDTNDKEKR